jgi:phage repressor protein C with HTH and peptisase S24 domain
MLSCMSSLSHRLRHLRRALGLSQEQFAQLLSVTRGAVGNWERDQGVSRESLEAISSKFGVTTDWLIRGDGPGPDLDRLLKTPLSVGEAEFLQRTMARRAERVPDLAIFGGMGGGGALEVAVDPEGRPADPDQVRGYWEFPDYMLRRFGDLRRIYAWEVRGDSMEPTIAGGSVVFVDTAQTVLPPDDIYAINYGDGLMVKRLKLVPRSERVSVISDNDRYGRDDLLREEVTVWGRVVGWFQWRG